MKKLFLFQAFMACLCIPCLMSCSNQEPDNPDQDPDEEVLVPKLVKSNDIDVKLYFNGDLLEFHEDTKFDLHFDWMNYSMKFLYDLPLREGCSCHTYRLEAKNIRLLKTEIIYHPDDPSYDEAAELSLVTTKQIDEGTLEIYVVPSQSGTLYKVYYTMEVEDWFSRSTTITNSLTFVTKEEDIFPDYQSFFDSNVYQDGELLLRGFYDSLTIWSDDRPQAIVGPEGGTFRFVLGDNKGYHISEMQVYPELFLNGEEIPVDEVDIQMIEKNEWEVTIPPSDKVRSVMITWKEYDRRRPELEEPSLVIFQNHLQYTGNTNPILLGKNKRRSIQ